MYLFILFCLCVNKQAGKGEMIGGERRELVVGDRRDGVVRSERNFDAKPFFVTNKGKEKRNWVSVVETEEIEAGMSIESTWTVFGHPALGLPGAYDQDIYMGSLRLLERQGGPDEQGKLWFKPYQLLEESGFGRSGRDYERLAQSIERVSGTHVVSERAFYSARLKRHISKGLGLWKYERAEHFGRRGSNLELSYLRFDDAFLESYEHGYLDELDSAFYASLQKPLSKRLFRLLNERCDSQGSWRVDAMVLRDLLPLGEYRFASEVIKGLRRSAHGELEKKGFLKGVEVVKSGGSTYLTYELAPNFGRRRLVDLALEDPRGQAAMNLLCSYYMSREDAAALVSEQGAERCIQYAEALQNQRNVRNPIGWLKRAIAEGWAVSERPRANQAKNVEPRWASVSDTGSTNQKRPEDSLGVLSPDSRAEEAWNAVFEDLAGELDTPSLRVWFEGTVPTGLDEVGTLTLTVPNELAVDYIGSRFKGMIEAALKNRLTETASLRLVDQSAWSAMDGGNQEKEER